MQDNILQCYSVMLPWQVMLPSGYAICLLAARAAHNTVIKRDERVTGSFRSLLSQCRAKHTKVTVKTQINMLFIAGCKILFGPFGNHRDCSLCKDAQANYRLYAVSLKLYIFCDLAKFNLLFFVNENNDYGYRNEHTV